MDGYPCLPSLLAWGWYNDVVAEYSYLMPHTDHANSPKLKRAEPRIKHAELAEIASNILFGTGWSVSASQSVASELVIAILEELETMDRILSRSRSMLVVEGFLARNKPLIKRRYDNSWHSLQRGLRNPGSCI